MVYWATLPEPETRQVLPSRSRRGAQHLGGKVDRAVARGLGPDQAAAPVEALAGEHAGELVSQFLVHAEQVADLPGAHADVAGGHVRVGTDMAEQFGHEALAEPHHLEIRFALGIEIAAALAAAHGQRGQAFLKTCSKARNLRMPRFTEG
jgi:hypothetical protein